MLDADQVLPQGFDWCFVSGEPLTEQQYLSEAWGGRRTLGMDVGLRKRAYQVFKSYERYLEDQERWDACDREVALVQRALYEMAHS